MAAAGIAALFSNEHQEALKYFLKAFAVDSTEASICARIGYVWWKSGKQDEARTMFERSRNLHQIEIERDTEWYESFYDLAAISSVEGKTDEIYRWLRKAIALGWRSYRLALRDPMFENLRAEVQFKTLMRNVEEMVQRARMNALNE